MVSLQSLTIRGFRSIRALEGFVPGNLTVLIGANGSGKSNFVEFFRMLRSLADEAFQRYAQTVGTDTLFFLGPKRTPVISARLELGARVYEVDIRARGGAGAFVDQERIQVLVGQEVPPVMGKQLAEPRLLGGPSDESHLKAHLHAGGIFGRDKGLASTVHAAVSSWEAYHVSDTSPFAPIRRAVSTSNNIRLASDAHNLAALLLTLQSTSPLLYQQIRSTIQLAAPFFDDFVLRPAQNGPETKVSLEWTQRGSQEPFQSTVLSDGTLRFIALVTALLQPNPPSAIVIDEPELGLYPFAIHLLGEAIRSAATRTQVILATHSPQLLDCFEPEHVVVVERQGDESVFRRLAAAELQTWLAEYSLGELWLKNVLGGRP